MPSPYAILPEIKEIKDQFGVEISESGRISTRCFDVVLNELLSEDFMPDPRAGLARHIEPDAIPFPLVMSYDGTGFGKLQISTAVLKNPFESQSCFNLRIIGLGSCGDGDVGRLIGEANLEKANVIARAGPAGIGFEVTDPSDGSTFTVLVRLIVVTDASAFRHEAKLAKSGICGCGAEMLRLIPEKPESVAEMVEMCHECHKPTLEERFTCGHYPHPGETLPRACTAPGCTYAHSNPARDYALLLKIESEIRADETAAGKRRYCTWRMDHAQLHRNIQPGIAGRPGIEMASMSQQLPDTLHGMGLNLFKTGDKHAYLNHMSDGARAEAAEYMESIKHKLDTRRKDDNRSRAEKWHTGEELGTLLNGERGSPGGPIVYAEKALIVAADLLNGTSPRCVGLPPVKAAAGKTAAASGAPPAKKSKVAAPAGRGLNSTSGFAGFGAAPQSSSTGTAAPVRSTPNLTSALTSVAARLLARRTLVCTLTLALTLTLTLNQVSTAAAHTPTDMELAADPEHLAYIREIFGSHAQLLISALLTADAFFILWRLNNKPMEFLGPAEVNGPHALAFCRAAIDYGNMLERVCVKPHKSWYPHMAIWTWPLNILDLGNINKPNMQSLECLNAEVKRTARSNASKRIECSVDGEAQVGPRKPGVEGPANLLQTKGYSSSLSTQVVSFMMGKQKLRRSGEGIATRVATRLFGVVGGGKTGRSTRARVGAKLEHMDADYDPELDSALAAFVRTLKVRLSSGEITFRHHELATS